ncbi:MAG: 3-dehydroquinate synthase [Wenzhouxiangellaceae bacterium]|nr:3-dehydroquinate synthase [Wenzhouxiangellaceae bacterium]
MPVLELNHATGCCRIHLERGLLGKPAAWRKHLSGTVLIVTDQTVAGHYLQRLVQTTAEFAPAELVLPSGEEAKTIEHWHAIVEKLAAIGAQRDATVVALGGGVIGDLAGFAAAGYMRGIKVIQVPTTLLAQVDAAIGGKTGFNLAAGKNLVGAFHQPAAVMVDVETLVTLDQRDFLAGLAEVVKYGAIRDAEFIGWLEDNADALLQRRADTLEIAVARAAAHKIEVVEADEREAGQRALLNFGHTFGHAIETATGYRRYRHGEAVAIGMHLAAALSARLGMISDHDARRLSGLLEKLGLPIEPPRDIEPKTLLGHMRLDKKNRAGRIRLILLEPLGAGVIRDDIEPNTLLELFDT